MPALEAERLTVAYRGTDVVRDVSLRIEPGEFVAVLGPNGSGKSTLLRALARLLRPARGRVLIEGTDARELAPRAVARRLALLAQADESGLDLTVEELVWRGRYPHQSLFRHASPADARAVERAMQAADVERLRDRPLARISGGERQRAWIALALAQEPRILLLDEPTSWLDLRQQVAVMDLLHDLNQREGLTVVAVLHDLLLAARYARRVLVMREGSLVLDGPTLEVLRPAALEPVFGVRLTALVDPAGGAPVLVPTLAPEGRPVTL